MAKLSTLLGAKEAIAGDVTETNLESGRIWGYDPANFGEFATGGRWFGCQLTDNDQKVATVEVEAWGPGGRGSACLCCCGGGVGGNPGAYIKFTAKTTRFGWMCFTGMRSCNSGGNCMCGGCGTSTCIQICPRCTSGTCSDFGCACVCVQPGESGSSFCHNGGSMMCCLGQIGFCITPGFSPWAGAGSVSTGCGYVCNMGNGSGPTLNFAASDHGLPHAYYSDASGKGAVSGVTCCDPGLDRVACIFYGHCNSCCWQCFTQFLKSNVNRYSTDGAELRLGHRFGNSVSYYGDAMHTAMMVQQGLTRSPGHFPWTACWGPMGLCQCYEWSGCIPWMAPTLPAPASFACSGVRTHGYTGGFGVVRIKYYGG